MKISIALPAYYNRPIGGYYVHYMYANLLASYGHQVTIIFPLYLSGSYTWKTPISTFIWAVKTRLKNRPLISAIELNKRVKIRLTANLESSSLPKADVLIATAWETAYAMREVGSVHGRKYFIVYDYEYWMTANPPTKDRIETTFRSDFLKIATSKCVQEMIESVGGECVALIPCGLDFDDFHITRAPEARAQLTLGFPIRGESFKGLKDAIAAAEILRDRYGDRLRVTAFGKNRLTLPDWIDWLEFPSQSALREFYNDQAVFMLPSHFEGWGLTGVEALACGAALVVTENGGSQDYAFDRRTALVVKPQDPVGLADAISELFGNENLRLKIAREGHQFVQRFTWAESGSELNALLSASV